MKIIGLSGKAGSGKDWVAKRILRAQGYQQIGFSWALKLEAMSQYGFTFEEVFQTKPEHVRAALIELGMKGRAVDPLFWVKRTMSQIEVLHREGGIDRFVITDVRFWNEAEAVRAAGGQLVRMLHGDRHYPLKDTEWETHESETGLDGWNDWDCVIRNNKGTSAAEVAAELRRDGVLPATRVDGALGRGKLADPSQLILWNTEGVH